MHKMKQQCRRKRTNNEEEILKRTAEDEALRRIESGLQHVGHSLTDWPTMRFPPAIENDQDSHQEEHTYVSNNDYSYIEIFYYLLKKSF